MKRKYKRGKKCLVCLLLTLALLCGTFQQPFYAGEVQKPKKEVSGGEEIIRKEKVFETEGLMEAESTEESTREMIERGTEENTEKNIEESPAEPAGEECIQVSGPEEMARAMQEESPEEMEEFSGKSLIIPGEPEFGDFLLDTESIIKGYGLTVLFYDEKEKAKHDYRKLREMGIPVEINTSVETCGKTESSALKEETEQGVAEKDGGRPAGKEVTVAVLDSGYDPVSHGEERIVKGMDFTGENSTADQNGHGTAMASVILANTPKEIKVMPVKVADETGFTTVLHLYMGIRYAITQGADVINISMSAYKSAHSGILQDVLKEAAEKGIIVVVSAGNQGGDMADCTPANIKEAVTVSAVDAEKNRVSYSNYGEGVDYCAYGSLEVTGIRGEKVTVTGTSVSAAVVSAVTALAKSENPEVSGEGIKALLDNQAEDLGEKGWDKYYGRGFLNPGNLKGEEKEQEEENLPELLTCDFKSLSDTDLNKLILEADDIYKKRFVEDLPQQDKKELFARKDILYNHIHAAVVQEVSKDGRLGEEKRFEGTLWEYLCSDFFREFSVNGSASQKHDGASQTIHISARSKGAYFVKLATSQDKTPANLYVWVNGYTSNPTSTYTLHAEGTNAGAFDFSHISVSANSSGNLDQMTVGGIKVNKTAHTTLKDKYQTRFYVKGDPDYKENETGDGGLGGFKKPGNDSCGSDSQNFSFLFTHNDGEHSSSNGNYALTYQLNYGKAYGTTPGKWGEWVTEKQNTCLLEGKKIRSRERLCSHCKKVVSKEQEEKSIPARGHLFAPEAWNYETCPLSGISRGVRFNQCSYNCGEEGWRKNYEYLQEIYYRVMDGQGNYPGEYNLFNSRYYPAGAAVPGYVYSDTEGKTNHRATVLPESRGEACARRQYVDIPRKEYFVKYDGNGADGGSMQQQHVYFGQEIFLLQNGYLKTGYDFSGYSTNPQGKGEIFGESQRISKNLTDEDFGTVTLYACFKPHTYSISLDSQGAKEQGTKEVFEKYGEWYSKKKEKELPFENNKIIIPQKNRTDESLPEKERKQKFLGYFTKESGQGYPFIKEDGSLIANIGNTGDYRYFVKDSKVYAHYQDMYAVSFSDNLSGEDKKIAGEKGHVLPGTKWKEQGKDLTLFFEGAEVSRDEFKKIYRLLGWSLTPEIKSEEELVLSPEKYSYTITEDKDVTLYAQWDNSYSLAYMGSGQTSGNDYIRTVTGAAKTCQICGNDEKEENFFEKEVEKDTMDIATGDTKDAGGKAYREKIPCSFQGFSMFPDEKQQRENKIFRKEEGEIPGGEILLDAVNAGAKEGGRGLTFGSPAKEYQTFVPDSQDEKMPYVNLFAVWDEFPQIKASDMYFSLSKANSGALTQEYLLGMALATDKELEGVTDEKGTVSPGEDKKNSTLFFIRDYREEDFTGAEGNMSVTITYCARDGAGNETRKMVTVHLVDTAAKEYETGRVRFISKEHIDTLPENSVWRTEEYAAVLDRVLKNRKTGEEYTHPSVTEQIFGAKAVKKPGSGSWDRVMQIWKFTHEQVLSVQDFLEKKGIQNSQQAFLDKFGACRIQ